MIQFYIHMSSTDKILKKSNHYINHKANDDDLNDHDNYVYNDHHNNVYNDHDNYVYNDHHNYDHNDHHHDNYHHDNYHHNDYNYNHSCPPRSNAPRWDLKFLFRKKKIFQLFRNFNLSKSVLKILKFFIFWKNMKIGGECQQSVFF